MSEGGHYPPAALGDREVSPWGRSRWPARLPPAHPAARTKSTTIQAGARDPRAPEGRQGLAPCSACQAGSAQPRCQANKSGFLPHVVRAGQHRPLSVTPSTGMQQPKDLMPGPERQPGAPRHALELCEPQGRPSASSWLIPLTLDYGNEVKASGSPANSH